MVLEKLDSNMQKNEPGPLSYTIHKNKLKMDEKLKCKTESHQNPSGENRQQPLWLEPQQLLTWMSPEARETKAKMNYSFLKEFFLTFIHFLRDTDSASGERTERETQNSKQALSCQHRAQHGVQTHEQWEHDLSQSRMLNLLSHPGAPKTNYSSSR